MRLAVLLPWMVGAWAACGGAWARHPVIVELFTAQGCSSCLKANTLVGQLADRAGVIVLTWPVDYWDYLGWKDTFAQPEFSDRQRLYDDQFGLRDVYTPQIVVDGAAQVAGDKLAAIDELIRKARRSRGRSPDLEFLTKGRLAVGSGRRPPGGGEVWLVRFDPREQDVEVKAGDNRGATVPQRNVVRQLTRLGRWTGRAAVFKTSTPADEGLTTLAIVQTAHGGPILGSLESVGAQP